MPRWYNLGLDERQDSPGVSASLLDLGRDLADAQRRVNDALRLARAATDAHVVALAGRDERIITLEGEKQDLLWRLQAALAQANPQPPPQSAKAAEPARVDEREDTLRRREQAIAELQRAATIALAENTRVRHALGEQAALAAELTATLAAAETARAQLASEVVTLREATATATATDGTRRARLAQVEGTLLRLQHQLAAAARAKSEPGRRDEGVPAPTADGRES